MSENTRTKPEKGKGFAFESFISLLVFNFELHTYCISDIELLSKTVQLVSIEGSLNH